MKEKLEKLKEIISKSRKCVIAFSGGVDSTLLLKVAGEIAGENCIAVTIAGPLNPLRETEEAVQIAEEFGVKHKILNIEISDFDWLENNPENRCYICKTKVFNLIKKEAEEFGADAIFDGTNLSDLSDYRPGLKALVEIGVISPLKEAELTKSEIREISKEFGIKGWGKPSFTCLATRFPVGSKISEEKLRMLEKAEEYLKEEGFLQFRVRCHDELARIEFDKSDMKRVFEENIMAKIDGKLKEIGFRYVAIDTSGYKTGNMN